MYKNCTFSFVIDKLRPDTGMKREIGVTATNDSLSNFNLQQRLSSLRMIGIHSYDCYSAGRTYHSKSKGM